MISFILIRLLCVYGRCWGKTKNKLDLHTGTSKSEHEYCKANVKYLNIKGLHDSQWYNHTTGQTRFQFCILSNFVSFSLFSHQGKARTLNAVAKPRTAAAAISTAAATDS